MSDLDNYPFSTDYDKRGTAKCKKCKVKFDKGMLRLAKIASNPFGEGVMKNYHHVDCFFASYERARATTKRLEEPHSEIEGWDNLEDNDQKDVLQKLKEFQEKAPKASTPKKPTPSKVQPKLTPVKQTNPIATKPENSSGLLNHDHKDNSFREFRRICANIADVSSYLSKTEIVSNFFKKGTEGENFKGDLKVWMRLLLPGTIKRVYNLQSKQLIKLFSQLFNTNQEEMLEDLEGGDVAETVRVFFEKSVQLPPIKKSNLTIFEVDALLEDLSKERSEEGQSYVLKKIAKRCTGNDLKMFVRLVKGDLRINAGAKHILEGIHSDAYEAFQTARNIDIVLDQIIKHRDEGSTIGSKSLKIIAQVMTPVLPMLAEACRSVEQALRKCPNGMYAEIKYDGERVQLHKRGKEFKYFSRSLKPVMEHKVSHFKDYIPSAFPHGHDLILDAEVLLIDNKTGIPLPFGSLGKHKKNEFSNANVCLFVFDCVHFNGEDLMTRPLRERRHTLETNMTEIKNRVVLSEMKEVTEGNQLQQMITRVINQGLEGLVLKDCKSVYEPGKRHWLKVKKDYLHEGAMADSADLVVLGAWYGTGKKGGMMSVFLMGCYDNLRDKWCTVTKVHTGHDDAALERLQTQLKMAKISQSADAVPHWLSIAKGMIPDFITSDPKKSPVWEITGAEFTQNKVHTASGISIRFPRVTKERPDKDWNTATDLDRLKVLYEKSKEHSEYTGLKSEDEDETSSASGSTSSTPIKNSGQKYAMAFPSPGKKRPSYGHPKESTPKRKAESENDMQKKKSSKIDDYLSIAQGKKNGHSTKNALPDIFTGVKLFIPEALEEAELLRRYFVGYGGEEVEEESMDATHWIHADKASIIVEEKLSADWLWDSIKLGTLQPTLPYVIK